MELATAAAAEDPCKRWRDCIDALEGERRKIEVFRRELPLCLELITQTIESCRQQMENSGRAPVLEKFMPMYGAYDGEVVEEGWEDAGRSVDEADGAVEESDDRGSEGKADWLRSVQLWSSHGRGQDQKLEAMRPIALDIGKGTGAFRPFSRENCCLAKQPSSAAVLAPSHQAAEEEEQQQQEHVAAGAESSTTETGGGEGCGSSSGKKASSEDQEKGPSRRKMRRCWSAELHRRFLNALGELGGAHIATPKQIREAMKVEGLTSDEIKSHLQKYRLHSRRPSIPAPSNPGSHQAPHFFLVGGIWVPPPEHAPAAAAAPPPRDRNNPPPNVVYTPVALAPARPNYNQKDLGQTFTTVPLQQARCTAAAGDRGSPSSPATSSCSGSTSTFTHS